MMAPHTCFVLTSTFKLCSWLMFSRYLSGSSKSICQHSTLENPLSGGACQVLHCSSGATSVTPCCHLSSSSTAAAATLGNNSSRQICLGGNAAKTYVALQQRS